MGILFRPACPAGGLAARARHDSGAFAKLYLRQRVSVFRYLRARCRSEDDAPELTAVTSEKALGGIGRYRPREVASERGCSA